MSVRSYDFVVGIETAAAPTPGTPTNDEDILSLGFANDTYARRSSWYDKQETNDDIRAIAVADRSTGQVVFQYTSDTFWKFDASSAAVDDDSTILEPDVGTGAWLAVASGGSGSGGDTLVQQFDSHVADLKAGMAIADRDAVCLDLHLGEYRVFKCDSDLSNRRNNFAGFAKNAATVTPEILTFTLSAAFVTGNSTAISLNGRSYTVPFDTSSDETLDDCRDAIASDPDIASAVVTVEGGNQTGNDDRVITVTGVGGLDVSLSAVVTGGASQPTIAVVTTQAPDGQSVDIHAYGPLDGFSSLTVGENYFIGPTAGGVTFQPADAFSVFAGQAIDTDTLFVDAFRHGQQFTTPAVYVRAGGSPTSAGSLASMTLNTRHFNFTAWNVGTAHANLKGNMGCGEAELLTYHHNIGGQDTASAHTTTAEKYDRISWSSITAVPLAKSAYAIGTITNKLVTWGGFNGGGALNNLHQWDGASWASPGSFGAAGANPAGFQQGIYVYKIAGNGLNNTDRWDGAAATTATNYPLTGVQTIGIKATGSKGVVGGGGSNETQSYSWDGASWSANHALNFTVRNAGTASTTADGPMGCAFHAADNFSYVTGGTTSGDVARTETQKFSGTAWSSSVSSSDARNFFSGSEI